MKTLIFIGYFLGFILQSKVVFVGAGDACRSIINSTNGTKDDVLKEVQMYCSKDDGLCNSTQLLKDFIDRFMKQTTTGSTGYRYHDRFVKLIEKFASRISLKVLFSDSDELTKLIGKLSDFAKDEFSETEIQTQMLKTYEEFEELVRPDQIISLFTGKNTESLLQTYMAAVHTGFKGHPDLEVMLNLFISLQCAYNDGRDALWEEMSQVLKARRLSKSSYEQKPISSVKAKNEILNDLRDCCLQSNNLCKSEEILNLLVDQFVNQTEKGSAGHKYGGRLVKVYERFARQFNLKLISFDAKDVCALKQIVENLKTFSNEEFSGSKVQAQMYKTFESFENRVTPELIVGLMIGESPASILEMFLAAVQDGFEGHPDLETVQDLFTNIQCSYNKGRNDLWKELMKVLKIVNFCDLEDNDECNGNAKYFNYTDGGKGCPSGFTHGADICYTVVATPSLTYEAARAFPSNPYGSRFAKIRTKEEWNFLISLLKASGANSVWIGLRDVRVKSDDPHDWRWEDGTSQPVPDLTGVTQWWPNEPNYNQECREIEACAHIRMDFGSQLNDIYCTTARAHVREWLASSCSEWHHLGHNKSGIYRILPRGAQVDIQVYCDMVNDGGGWTVVQSRKGNTGFDKSMLEYTKGFGTLTSDFWLGLEYISQLTSQEETSLSISFKDVSGRNQNIVYSKFQLSKQESNFEFRVSKFDAASFDALKFAKQRKVPFSVDKKRGGWWFSSNSDVNLNGDYPTGHPEQDKTTLMQWSTETVVIETEMKIKTTYFTKCA